MNVQLLPFPAGLVAPGASGAPFERLAELAAVPIGAMVRVTRADLDLLIVHATGGLCVIDDRCPHMAAPLSLGTLTECVVACPLHRGAFDVSSGDVVQFPTTGGLDADGGYHAPWAALDTPARAEPTDLKARARAATRVRRLRYYPARVANGWIEARLPAEDASTPA